MTQNVVITDVREFDPNVVILDIVMPGKNGWQAAEEIRATTPGSSIVLVGLSGEHTSGADRMHSRMSGFDFY